MRPIYFVLKSSLSLLRAEQMPHIILGDKHKYTHKYLPTHPYRMYPIKEHWECISIAFHGSELYKRTLLLCLYPGCHVQGAYACPSVCTSVRKFKNHARSMWSVQGPVFILRGMSSFMVCIFLEPNTFRCRQPGLLRFLPVTFCSVLEADLLLELVKNKANHSDVFLSR